ncbi:MAG TPA: LysR family transcriptional regulator [Kofleriaceae bacterium]|nr:LysR family transcriptional regulator [Kofleriaceae bacterium]
MDLNRASAFVRVVETGGFTRAAEALGLPPSSVSRSVAKLEHDLGVTLLERTTRKIALTDAGRAYFERAREALAGLEQANELALDAAREAHGTVRVAVPPGFAPTFALLLGPLLAQHPRVRVEVAFTTRGAELVGDLVDLALVVGRLPDSSLVARRLGGMVHRIYAAPSYLAARGTPRTLAQLAEHDAIVQRATAGDSRWELTGPRGAERVDLRTRVVGDHIGFIAEAAAAGLGVALLPSFVGDRAVAAARLVPVLPKYSAEMPLHVLTSPGRHVAHRVALVRDFLIAHVPGECRRHQS